MQIVPIISVAQFRGEEMYRRSLRAYQAYLAEIKSIQRDTAAVAREDATSKRNVWACTEG